MSVEVVVPWMPGCEYRGAALEWVLTWYEQAHPEWTVTVANGGDPWCKGIVVNAAVRSSASDIVIVADADCLTDGLAEAVGAVEDGAPFAIPHHGVYRLSEQGTANFYDGQPWHEQPLTQPAYRGYPGGGFVVARRETLLDIPLDPRFVGWGYEDESWARALKTLAGDFWRGKPPLIHLWHPPQPRRDRNHGSRESELLCLRYVAAELNPDDMRSLIKEFSSDNCQDDYTGMRAD